jgi:hypothetical protein
MCDNKLQLTVHKWTKNITAYHSVGWQVEALSEQEGICYYQMPKNDKQVAPRLSTWMALLKS